MTPTAVSPLARGRGLKRDTPGDGEGAGGVAPRAGAWIETSPAPGRCTAPLSPLARGRGLKQDLVAKGSWLAVVAPRAGAWIETSPTFPGRHLRPVAPRAGAWIETPEASSQTPPEPRRPSRGGVD